MRVNRERADCRRVVDSRITKSRVETTKDKQLEVLHLREEGFNWTVIAAKLGMHRTTAMRIHERAKRLGTVSNAKRAGQ